jgi:hypothetical protein
MALAARMSTAFFQSPTGQLYVGLRVQVQERLTQRLEPAIHIFAGLKVCIQAMTPITRRRRNRRRAWS